MTRSTLLSLAALAPLAAAAPALPCSPALPSLEGATAPADSATPVPTNGVLHAELFEVGGAVRASVRADTATESVNLDVDDTAAGVVRVNLAPLAPATSYTLTLTLPASVAFTEEDLVREIDLVTGAGPDTTPPVLEGDAEVVVEHQGGDLFGPAFGTCSVAETTNFVTVTPPSSSDDTGVAGHKLFRVRDDGARQLRAFRLGGGALIDSQPEAGDYRYEIVAVDLAGNESDPLLVEVNVSGCTAAGGAPAFVALLAALARVRGRRARANVAA